MAGTPGNPGTFTGPDLVLGTADDVVYMGPGRSPNTESIAGAAENDDASLRPPSAGGTLIGGSKHACRRAVSRSGRDPGEFLLGGRPIRGDVLSRPFRMRSPIVAKEQRKDCEPRPVSIMELSATQRSGREHENSIRLNAEDEKDCIVVERIDARKRMRLHECDKKQRIQDIVDLAYCHNDSQVRVLIYVRTPRDAQSIESKLRRKLKANQRTALLTGTIRGYERDNLATANPAYKQFVHPEDGSLAETIYLISTSAGEVGIDIDADHMVCDMTTMDSMIQRLGRVNRRGGAGRVAQVDVVWTCDDENADKDKAVAKTLEILRRWTHENLHEDGKFNASPRNVRQLMEKLDNQDLEEAFSPKPVIPPLSDILLDAWSLTSVNKMPGRPEVADYLHGLTNDRPNTYIAWRKEIPRFSQNNVDERILQEWFAACPVRANERMRMRTDVLRGELRKLIRTHGKNKQSQEHQVVLLNERNQAEWARLSELDDRAVRLEYKTVVLPMEVGGLGQHGIFDSSVWKPAHDVANSNTEGIQRERWLYESGEDRPLISGQGFGSSWEVRERVLLASHEDSDVEESAGGNSVELILRMPKKELASASPDVARMRQTLVEHTDLIVRHMKAICNRLHLDPDITSALVSGACRHDRGKDRDIWQRFACNGSSSDPLAKSSKYLHGRALSGYRHEFGSVLEAMNDLTLYKERDLILHLIAAHHGHARPYF